MNTNKIDLIKAEVERLKSQLLRGACSSQVAMETRCKEEAYDEVLAILDTMQEEPAPKVFEDMLNAKTAAESLGISPEEHDKIVDECLYGKEPELVDIDDLPVVVDAPSEDYVKGFADGSLYEQRQKSETSVWHDANKLPDNPEDIVIEHSEYGTAIIPACKMSRVKGAKWARLDDILKL